MQRIASCHEAIHDNPKLFAYLEIQKIKSIFSYLSALRVFSSIVIFKFSDKQIENFYHDASWFSRITGSKKSSIRFGRKVYGWTDTIVSAKPIEGFCWLHLAGRSVAYLVWRLLSRFEARQPGPWLGLLTRLRFFLDVKIRDKAQMFVFVQNHNSVVVPTDNHLE